MMAEVHVRISNAQGEFEIRADQSYVEQFRGVIDGLLTSMESSKGTMSAKFSNPIPTPTRDQDTDFPEALLSLPSSVSGGEKLLIAARFIQRASQDNTYSTLEANKLLTDQGIKLSNPSQSNANALKAKRVFKVGKRFRLSSKGEEVVASLIGK